MNEAFAKKFKLGRDAVGKHMDHVGREDLEMEIVGLVKDAKYSDVKDDVPPVFFLPWAQDSTTAAAQLLRAHVARPDVSSCGRSRR